MNAPQLITENELQDITGAKMAYKQREVLEKYGIFYIERLDGAIRTTWHHVNNPLNRPKIDTEEPDWSSME